MKKTEPGIKIKSTWDFSSIYSGYLDKKILADVKQIESAYISFAKKYSSEKATQGFMTSAAKLKTALDDWNTLMGDTGTWKPIWYLHLLLEVDTQNNKVKAIFTKLIDQLTKASNQILFFNLKLGKISKENQVKFLKDPKLATYKTFLASIFEIAKYNLSEAEEKILSLKYTPAHEMWVSAQKKLLTSQMVKHKGKLIPITEAQVIKADLPIKERRALHENIIAKYKEVSFLAEAELNAIITNKRVTDELRGLTKPYEATVLGYQNSVKSVEALVEAVSKYFPDVHKLMKIRAKALGLPRLKTADIRAKISKSKKKYTIEEGISYVNDAFRKIKPEFADLFMKFVREGRLDIYPRSGKRNGAFCSGGVGVPTHILLNHTSDINSMFTIAHEMGHAIHFEASKKQIPIYEDFTISIAEVASTFFENVFFDYVYEKMPDSEKKYMLMEKLEDASNSIYAQISFFKFELDLHNGIKEKGTMSAAEIANLSLKHRKELYGNAVEFLPDDGYFFVMVPHFRSFFYVYAYAYGQLIANALYAEYKKNPAFLEKIEYFLSAGGSKKPDDIFKDIGIDVTKPDFFEKGLKEMSEQIKEVQKLFK